MVLVSEDEIYTIQTIYEFHLRKNLQIYNFLVHFIFFVVKF